MRGASQQLRFFPPGRPLRERLGTAFFKSLPKAPGIYRMYDEAGRLLYVGQSRHLKNRISSYKYIHPDRDSSRMVRLVNTAARIEFETCPDAHAALQLETKWLRQSRPRFNRMNTYQKLAPFIGLWLEQNSLILTFRRHCSGPTEPLSEREKQLSLFPVEGFPEETQWFGAFFGPASAAFQALGRLCHHVLHARTLWQDYPRSLTRERVPTRICFHGDATPLHMLQQGIRDYLDGRNASLMDLLPPPGGSCFDDEFLENDRFLLVDFYDRGPCVNRELRTTYAISDSWVSPEVLHDLA